MKNDAKELLNTLSSGPVQQYILENENQDVREMVLKNKALFSIPAAQLSGQIAARRKAKEKLPLYYDTPGIIYPPAENLEQSSSQTTALFKSKFMRGLLPEGQPVCADLTGGFGIDAYFLSKNAHNIHYVEPDQTLLEIARHNHQLLGGNNIEHHFSTAENFLETIERSFDFIYIDPSRRSGAGKKIHAFADSHPDVVSLKNKILQKAPLMLVKASPLLDIQAGMSKLGNVRKVLVISVKNECKEVLFLCGRDFAGTPLIEAVNILDGDAAVEFHFTFPGEQQEVAAFSDPLRYLYEPNAAILKAGAFKSVATRFSLKKISRNTHLYTGVNLVHDFPGKRFEIETFVKPSPAEVRALFPGGQANVTTRNYPMTPDALRKKTGLKEGGEKFLIGLSGERKKFLVVASKL